MPKKKTLLMQLGSAADIGATPTSRRPPRAVHHHRCLLAQMRNTCPGKKAPLIILQYKNESITSQPGNIALDSELVISTDFTHKTGLPRPLI